MSNIRAVVVDDEPRARSRMRRLLDDHADVVVVAEADSGEEALRQILAVRPDVVFLDVRMPGVSGTEVAEQLVQYLPEAVRPSVVFTTAHAEHAVEAFAVQGLDYLLKPVERERLGEALRRVRQRLWARSPVAVAVPAESEPSSPVLVGHRGSREERVPAESIVFVEIVEGVAFAERRQGGRIRLADSLGQVEATLPSPPFVRVSRSAIVHTGRIEGLRTAGAGPCEADVEGGHVVAISRRRVRHVRRLMGLDD